MRRKHSFILTILPDDEIDGDLRGRIQSVSDRSTRTFKCADELHELIYEMLKSENYSVQNWEQNTISPFDLSN